MGRGVGLGLVGVTRPSDLTVRGDSVFLASTGDVLEAIPVGIRQVLPRELTARPPWVGFGRIESGDPRPDPLRASVARSGDGEVPLGGVGEEGGGAGGGDEDGRGGDRLVGACGRGGGGPGRRAARRRSSITRPPAPMVRSSASVSAGAGPTEARPDLGSRTGSTMVRGSCTTTPPGTKTRNRRDRACSDRAGQEREAESDDGCRPPRRPTAPWPGAVVRPRPRPARPPRPAGPGREQGSGAPGAAGAARGRRRTRRRDRRRPSARRP